MATSTTLIQSISLTGSQASIDFTSIPGSYTDLLIKLSARDATYASALATGYMTFNSSSTGYSGKYVLNNSGTTGSANGGTGNIYIANIPATTATASTFGNAEIYIPNYASANYKSASVDCVPENSAATTYMTLFAGLWSNTAAITRVTFTCDGTFAQYSIGSLYGIKNS